ncbi:MAG: S41 family peptidase [Paludibacteraceae bacterium]
MKKYISFAVILFVSVTTYAQGISPLQQRKLAQALSAISGLYVDSINDKEIVESSIRGVLEELDPHSTYIAREEVQRMHEPLEGSFEGIGVQFQIIKDTINVVQTVSGTPAEKVGVLPGDKIIYIDTDPVAGVKIQNTDVFKRLRGKRGTPVNIRVKRGNSSELIEFKIIRDKIPIYSVDASYMLTDKIGYIKINSFGTTTTDEFNKALKELKAKGMKDLILSLERNGGGFLKTAIDLADEFLPKDRLIVYTQGLNNPRTEAKSTAAGNFESGRLVVLVDEFSASASEILSGAIQDWDRGVIIGRRTFGKGLVQREFSLVDGSMMRLTVARYYTPTGRNIQKPYVKGDSKDYEKDLELRFEKGEMMHSDSIHFPDSLKYNTLVSHRTVYGGGGIMPDIFVPLDTTENTLYHRKIVGKGIVNTTVIDYLNANREILKKKYPVFDKFNKEFEVDESLLKTLISNAEKEKIPFDQKDYDRSEKLIKLQMKAIIANDLWNINEYYEVINKDNEILQKAVEVLSKKGTYEKILDSKQ